MEIQKNISATMKRKCKEYRNQKEFAQELGVGHTTLQTCLAGKGNPNAETIELLARGMKISPAELVSGKIVPAGKAFDLISGMVDTLHPMLQETGVFHLEALRRIFQRSEEYYAKGTYWKYTVTEPQPFRYALQAMERINSGWAISKTSDVFTDDHLVAEAAAELFTRNSLSPIHLEDAIEDYMNSL